MKETRFEHGRAHVESTVDDAELSALIHDGGRGAVLSGAASLSEWLVWDWTRQTDERLDALAADVYDVAEQAHRLATLVVAAFLIFAVALSIVIGVIVL